MALQTVMLVLVSGGREVDWPVYTGKVWLKIHVKVELYFPRQLSPYPVVLQLPAK